MFLRTNVVFVEELGTISGYAFKAAWFQENKVMLEGNTEVTSTHLSTCVHVQWPVGSNQSIVPTFNACPQPRGQLWSCPLPTTDAF